MEREKTISIDLPADIYLAVNENEADLIKDIKFSLAVRFYQQQKLTIGKAAQVAGMSRLKFESLLSENKIPISTLDLDDVNKDIEKLK